MLLAQLTNLAVLTRHFLDASRRGFMSHYLQLKHEINYLNYILYTSPLKKSPRVNPTTLAKHFDGYSASDIKDVCQGAQLQVVNELFNSPGFGEPVEGEMPSQPRELMMSDFRDIKNKRKPSVSTEMVRAYHKWSEQFGAL